jgi:hypothetical protein
MKNRCDFIRGCAVLLMLMGSLPPAISRAQEIPSSRLLQDTSVIWMAFKDTISEDSTLSIFIGAINSSRDVREAVVSLIDSTAGDTIQNWYPILPPQSTDSTLAFWTPKEPCWANIF